MTNSKIFSYKNLLIYASVFFVIIYLKSVDYLSLPAISNFKFLAAAFLFLIFGFMFQIVSWHLALQMFGERLLFKLSFMSIARTVFAKYIPGKIWQITGRAGYVSEYAGITLKRSIRISVFVQLLSILIALLLGALIVLLDVRVGNVFDIDVLFIFSFVFFILVAISATIVIFRLRCGLNEFLVYFSALFLPWLFWGIGFHFLMFSMGQSVDILLAVGIFTFAALAGILAYIFPGGIGVREGVIVMMLNVYGIPMDIATGISVLARLWFLVGELCFFLMSYLVKESDLRV